ncbi:MAG: DUF4412 domain-containing protein [Armatimonadota bacterium]|nr:DUF4412 domain-containing protein [Armatimonadota bacterium]
MIKTPLTAVTLAAALAALTVSAAHADLKVVQTTRIDNPQLKAYMETMTPQQRAQMSHSDNPLLRDGPQVSTVYLRGGKSRADLGGMTYITDAATHQTTIINRRKHTYSTVPTPANSAGAASRISATVKDTGQMKVIQGHPSRRYALRATLASQPGTIIQGDIWAAQDLPRPLLPTSGQGPYAILQDLLRKVKGFPLKTSLAVVGSPMGSTTVTSSAVSVSQAPLPASLFAVPAGYAKSSGGGGE